MTGVVFPVGNLGDGQGALVTFLDFGAHLDRTAPFTVVITRDVDESAGLKVGIECKRLALQVGDGGVEQFIEVVGQNFDREAHGDTFYALSQQERELGGAA